MHYIGGTLVEYSGNSVFRQGEIGMTDIIRARLREERMRVEPRQNIFADKLGVKQSTLSEWETKSVSMKYDHLALLAAAGIDLAYVFSGRRGSNLLTPGESVVLDSYRRMDPADGAAFAQIGERLVAAAAATIRD